MEINFVKVYLDLNKELCRTMTIKSEISADLLNEQLIATYGAESVDLNDPYSWKYYLNISGSYHLHDEVMQVVSLDTLTTIDFTKDNLANHRTTARAYVFGTRYYYSLVAKYPKQEQLILGILYPSDENTDVEAADGTILNYPSDLVEEQEISLIASLQAYIYKYKVRWDVPAFNVSDEYYSLAQHAIMYLNILTKLINIRLERCKTDEAHSFHIRQYLASHNSLDIYLPYMTLKQSLFLYRNLLYIENNSGKTDQFAILVEKLLTDRRIPLSEYSIRHLATFDSSYTPEITIRRKAINERVNSIEQEFFDMSLLVSKESDLSTANEEHYEVHQASITNNLKNSDSGIIQTKDLESAMVDYTDAVPDPYRDVLLREWAFNSLTGIYNTNIIIYDPRTLEPIIVSVQDAFIYSYYLALSAIGMDVVDLPTYVSFKHRLAVLPTAVDMRLLVDGDYDSVIDDLLAEQLEVSNLSSILAFNEHATNIYDEAYKHWFMESSTHDLYERVAVKKLISSLYEVHVVELPTETNDMSTWLADRGLPDHVLTYDESEEFIESIFEVATGFTIDDTTKLANIQRSMIAILTVLKSYSTQTIVEINDSGVKILNWAAIRLGNIDSQVLDDRVIDTNVRVLSTDAISTKDIELDHIDSKAIIDTTSVGYSDIAVDTNITVASNIIDGFDVSVFDTINILGTTYPELDDSISDDEIFIGYETYLALTAEQQALLSDIHI